MDGSGVLCLAVCAVLLLAVVAAVWNAPSSSRERSKPGHWDWESESWKDGPDDTPDVFVGDAEDMKDFR
jgi:hypothetical protein